LLLNSQCECLSPSRSPLRGTEPDQGVRRRSRLHDPHSYRQREEHRASKCVPSLRRKSLPGDARDSSKPASTARPRRSRTAQASSATCPTTSTTPWRTSRRRNGPQPCSAKTSRAATQTLSKPPPTAAPAPSEPSSKRQEVQFHHEVYNQFLWNIVLNRCSSANRPGQKKPGAGFFAASSRSHRSGFRLWISIPRRWSALGLVAASSADSRPGRASIFSMLTSPFLIRALPNQVPVATL